jgi:pimeloyl-ACP methyl ester carboxylesterase
MTIAEIEPRPGCRVAVEVHHPDATAAALFSSGLGLPMSAWRAVVPLLADVRCVLVDRPGIGRSPARPDGPDPLAAQVTMLLAALESSGPSGRVVVVGHSAGALAAEALARLRPDLVTGLVLVDPTDPRQEAVRLQLEGAAARVAERVVGPPAVAHAVGVVVGRAALALGTARRPPNEVRDELLAVTRLPRHLQASVRELGRIRAESLELLAIAAEHPLTVDTRLLVAGRGGRFAPWPTGSRRMAALGASLGVTPVTTDAAHLVMADDPQAVADAVNGLLAR